MPLATKNNAIIVKDGKLAENCGCCGCGACLSGTVPTTIRVQFTLTANDGMVSFEVPLRTPGLGDDGQGRICNAYSAFWGNAHDLGFAGNGPWFNQVDIPFIQTMMTYTYQGSDSYSGSDSYIGSQLTFYVSNFIEVAFVGNNGVGLGAAYSPRITFVSSLGYLDFQWGPTPSPLVYYQFGGRQIYYHTPPYQSEGTAMCYSNWPGLVALPIQGGFPYYPTRTGAVSITVNSVE